MPGGTGFCFFGDCWGFSASVAVDAEQALASVESVQAVTETFVSEYDDDEMLRMFAFSDSLLLAAPTGPDKEYNRAALDVLVAVTKKASERSLEVRVPMRGAVAFGSLAHSPRGLTGGAVVSAVRIGESLSLPLSTVPEVTIRAACAANTISRIAIEHPDDLSKGDFGAFIDLPTKDDGLLPAKPLLLDVHEVDTAMRGYAAIETSLRRGSSAFPRELRVLADTKTVLTRWRQLVTR
jgi:hypothetical protein